MAEIKCPHCGKVFTVDESGYMAIASQIRDKEFEKELKKKEEAIVTKYDLKKSDEEKALNDKITALLHQLEDKDKEKEIALLNATSELKEENIKLQNMINGEKDRTQIEVSPTCKQFVCSSRRNRRYQHKQQHRDKRHTFF